MNSSNPKRHFLRGMRDALPFILVLVPFAALFGVVATEAGLNVVEVMSFSVLVIAGAAQFTAIQLMTENAPTIIVILTALAVNLRMAMYSASLTPYLGQAPMWRRAIAAYFMVDQPYALSQIKFEMERNLTVSERYAYYFGTVAPLAPFWYGSSYVGAVAGAQVPPAFALDFAMPITFLAMIAPALRTLAHVAAATTSIILALLMAWMPYGSGLLVAAIGAMIVGAQVELLTARKARQ
ncbi:Predicted branched-chain amino acid permease (azaleucine resistance) [Aliiroseovarius sediminilitoris]|uniref:Predicted branched-chain amino acid permease (Azaleucine resistance) n=1 Tax=Aliiroseovarius sediminilitoris TaxID=1173584 RepID=A0A1I0N1J6_9RHOB|nr:AzlC family ABC transporter permease [Aliiroseovarius sediminilitoris]SEV94789.1 Predicted branched-chain amino acid permease (azaleucine resistance) [Aliiroseovarius sediminilitoris]